MLLMKALCQNMIKIPIFGILFFTSIFSIIVLFFAFMISFIYKLAKEMNDKMLSLRLNQSFFKVTKKR